MRTSNLNPNFSYFTTLFCLLFRILLAHKFSLGFKYEVDQLQYKVYLEIISIFCTQVSAFMQPNIILLNKSKTYVPLSACTFKNTQVPLLFTTPSMHTHVAHAGSPKSNHLCGSAKMCCLDCRYCTVHQEEHHPSPQLLLSQCLCVRGHVCIDTKTKCKISSRP